MKDSIQTVIKRLYSTRVLAILTSINVALSLTHIIWVSMVIQVSDVQRVARYTVFGQTHYYKEEWYWMYAIPIGSLVIFISNCIIASKLLSHKLDSMARFLLVITIFILLATLLHTRQLLMVAFP